MQGELGLWILLEDIVWEDGAEPDALWRSFASLQF